MNLISDAFNIVDSKINLLKNVLTETMNGEGEKRWLKSTLQKAIDTLPLGKSEKRVLKKAFTTINNQDVTFINEVDLFDYLITLYRLSLVEIPTELREALTKFKIQIRQEKIQSKLSQLVEAVENVTLSDVSCTASRITIRLTVKKYGTVISYLLHTRISAINISSTRQELELDVLEEEMKGQNLIGQIACLIVPRLMPDITDKMILRTSLSKYIEKKHKKSMKVKLASMDVIKSLKTPLPSSSKSWLDLISISDASHIEGGILLIAKVG